MTEPAAGTLATDAAPAAATRLVLAAANHAARAHAGQLRKGRMRVAYVNHPLRVAELVAAVTDDPETVAAALLHDVLEDTADEPADLATAFGPRVAALVAELTDDADWIDLPLAGRKAAQAAKFAGASDAARIVKIADQIANLEDLAAEPEVWPAERHRTYQAGARAIVAACAGASPVLAEFFEGTAARHAAAIAALDRPQDEGPTGEDPA